MMKKITTKGDTFRTSEGITPNVKIHFPRYLLYKKKGPQMLKYIFLDICFIKRRAKLFWD
jgi:hypothetical protein